MLTFPGTCSYNHAAASIADKAVWATHLNSAHPNDLPRMVARAFIPDAASQVMSVLGPTNLSPMASMGITEQKLRAMPKGFVVAGNALTVEMVNAMIVHIGEMLPKPMLIDPSTFAINFLVTILHTAGSAKASMQGPLVLQNLQNDEVCQTTWEVFHSLATKHCKSRSITYYPRSLFRTIDHILWDIWCGEYPAIATYKEHGTPMSRAWVDASGQSVPAWVVIPDLFNSHLTPEWREVREAVIAKANLSNGSGRVEYIRPDQDGDVAEHIEEKAALDASVAESHAKARAHKSSGKKGRRGKANKN